MITIFYLPDLRTISDLVRFKVQAESFAIAIEEFSKQTGLNENNIFKIMKF